MNASIAALLIGCLGSANSFDWTVTALVAVAKSTKHDEKRDAAIANCLTTRLLSILIRGKGVGFR